MVAPLYVHCVRAVAPPFVFFAREVTAVDVKTKKTTKQRELGAEKLESNQKIKSRIKYRKQ